MTEAIRKARARSYRLLKGGPSEGFVVNLCDDERLALLAGCIADQQRAGFGDVLDLRQIECPCCTAPGFNTGWGFWRHTCGAESHDEGVSGCKTDGLAA
jgi:hypothetical protein